MKKIFFNIVILAIAFLMAACEKDKFVPVPAQISAPDKAQFVGNLDGFDYTISWKSPADSLYIMYAVYKDGSQIQGFELDVDRVNQYTVYNTETCEEYEFVFKYCTKRAGVDGPISAGTVISYTRPGAAKVKNLVVEQIEDESKTPISNTAVITWDPVIGATEYVVTVEVFDKKGNLIRTELKDKSITENKLEYKADYNEKYVVSVASKNEEGIAIATTAERLIGKTKNAFLSLYPTESILMSDGDDDEKCAWRLLKWQFPNMRYISMDDVVANPDLLSPLRMCFFIRDVETGYEDVYNMPQAALNAAPIIGEWVKNGGNLCLWSHAVVYIGTIGRFPADQFAGGPDAIGAGPGGHNPDLWKMGATIKTDGGVYVDNVDHPLFRGLRTEKTGDGITLIPCKGAGWTEDHNCGWFDRPSWWTEQPNNAQACYDILKNEYGVTLLGTWDSQAWWISQMLVWEAGPAATPNPKFEGNSWEGTILCCANGGFEISMKLPDGSEDLTMSVNSEQDQINKLVRNAVEYLMSK